MLTPKQRKEACRKHRDTNEWLVHIGRPKLPMPFELQTEKERRAAERQFLKKQKDLEDKRILDFHIKEAFGRRLPYDRGTQSEKSVTKVPLIFHRYLREREHGICDDAPIFISPRR